MANRTKTIIGFTLVLIAMMWGVLVLRAYLNSRPQIEIWNRAKIEKAEFVRSLGVKETDLQNTIMIAHILQRDPNARYLAEKRAERQQEMRILLDGELQNWDSDFRIVKIVACVATLRPYQKIESSSQFLPGIIIFIVILVTGLYFIHTVLYIPSDNSSKESEETKQTISVGKDT
jgi:hypothetical protein